MLSPAVGHAQPGKGKPVAAEKADAKGDKKPSKEVNLDEDAGPVTAGQMTEEAAQGKRLFDSERWNDAARQLKRVVDGDTGDDEGNKQIAQYHLAIALYRLQFYQASYAIFSQIADKPNHLKFNETLLWLSKLATQLPEPADIIERVGKYKTEQVARFNNPQQRDLYWQLNYLLGRYKYRNRNYEEAISLFAKVDPNSKYYVQAQFFSGISYVQLRKSVPAVKSFQRIVQAIDEGVEGLEDEARMRDLAFLSMARTYYSASVRLDDNNVPTIDAAKLSAAVKYWNRVDVASEYWLDSLFEQSWAYFMAGLYPQALGNIHTIESPYFPNSFYPEADILKAVVSFTICQYGDATTVVAKMKKKYEPIKKELESILTRFQGEGNEERFFQFLKDVGAGKANLSPTVRPIVENALSDRQLRRNMEYVRILDEEADRFKKAPANFRNSPVGSDVTDALEFARSLAIRNAGTLGRERYQRNLDELNEHLRDSSKILIDITAAERNKLDQQVISGQLSKEDALTYGVVKPDDEHVLWPFNGEYWRDELGFYRQVVTSKCSK
ncbi:tetratricopeptide repeat protein [Sorangium sp. So ce1000]|uniref:tetratricopeptide repeat protein n=1 Tax=Sorangium sp. So ce1000 TaxID=3133325 RepID=UPI003F5F0C58